MRGPPPLTRRLSARTVTVAWLGLIALLSLWYYWPSLRWPVTFHTRDGRPVTGTRDPGDARTILGVVESVRAPRDVAGWFTRQWTPGPSNYYRPVTLLSIWLDYAVWGERPLGYRLHNLLLHIVNALLLGLVVARVAKSLWPGAVASLLVALSGTDSAATAWLAGRADLLASFFFLSALALLLAIRPQEPRRYLWPLAVVAFLLALGSKEIAVSLPALVTAWMFLWPRPLARRRRALIALSLWVALGVFWIVRARALGGVTSAAWSLDQAMGHVGWRNYAEFLARPLTAWYYELPWIGWISLLTPSFWSFILYQAVYWGCAALMLTTARAATIAFFVWKVVVTPPILGATHFFVWLHYWYLPSMGSAALAGIAVWQVARLAPRWWARLVARLRQMEVRLTT